MRVVADSPGIVWYAQGSAHLSRRTLRLCPRPRPPRESQISFDVVADVAPTGEHVHHAGQPLVVAHGSRTYRWPAPRWINANATAGEHPTPSLESVSAIPPGIDIDLDLVADICRRYGVSRLDVFGSASRGEMTDASDIDVLYELAPETQLGWAIEDLARELTDALGRPVDFVSRRYLHRRLRDHVLAEATPLYDA